ncbi:hypothetical protein RRG08_053868 [Elysia crispata]|uniref:Uncharacterized protein n=1 Tax=Elysia crispata TaxID=231223 RepID=A0AAE0YNB7_9GAST|nr:hypothetical protein RRG08_053868 [Elysia crispata]
MASSRKRLCESEKARSKLFNFKADSEIEQIEEDSDVTSLSDENDPEFITERNVSDERNDDEEVIKIYAELKNQDQNLKSYLLTAYLRNYNERRSKLQLEATTQRLFDFELDLYHIN